MLVRKFLHANGYRYKLHDKSLPGKPDIACPDGQTGCYLNTKQ
jgi:DNA mismatch endonuclease (patch repair protein)